MTQKCIVYGSDILRISKSFGQNLKYSIFFYCDLFGDYTFIGPGAVCTSHTVIEPETYIGSCSTTINGVTIGRGSVVGASTLVNTNIRPGATVVGVPARELDK